MKSLEMSLAVAFLVVVSPGASFAQSSGGSKAEVDPKADALLRKMSTDLAQLKSFTVDTRSNTEMVTKEGQKIDMLASSSVSLQRPNKLRTDRNGARADVEFVYDGRNVSVWSKRKNVYASAAAPATIDKTIDFARDDLSIDAPAADLLYSNPYNILMEDVVSGRYIGEELVGGRRCHHLAYRGNETDWQIWIEDGPRALPCRFAITSKKVAGEPDYEVELNNWRVDPNLPAESFVFRPPPGSTKIPFLTAKERARTARSETRAR